MDINETLNRLRELCREDDNGPMPTDAYFDMVELFEALDEWLSKGGFLPTAWVPSLTG